MRLQAFSSQSHVPRKHNNNKIIAHIDTVATFYRENKAVFKLMSTNYQKVNSFFNKKKNSLLPACNIQLYIELQQDKLESEFLRYVLQFEKLTAPRPN